MQLSEIWIYPVKSLGGFSVQQTEVTTRGLKYDRRWMLIDTDNVFVTQRQVGDLALFKTAIEENTLYVTHSPTGKTLPVNMSLYQSTAITVEVWDDEMDAYEVSEEASAWFSELLGKPVRLVYMPDESLRPVDPKYAQTPEDITSFSDGYPILVIGQSSLDDLNNRLEKQIPINRFRPNFVFTGGNAFEEESWFEFSIGTTSFKGVKPCARCIVTTLNHETGQKTGKEPLHTLSTYRKVGNKILFGQNVLIVQTGTVSVGEEITVQTTRQLAKFSVS
jgi:uncharacterized protein YcbX